MPVTKQTIELFQILRCADVCDALDSMGLQDRYEMGLAMRPMFPGIRFAGIARTQEFEKFDHRMPAMSYDEFDQKQYKDIEDGGYSAYTRPGVEPYVAAPGDVVVIAAHGTRAGVLGSANTLDFMTHGVVGMVIDGTCRDSGECIMQRSPVFSTVRSYTHPMGRIRIKGTGEPVVCAGVNVCDGDMIIADDDGVICVPQKIADEVAKRAYRIQQKDRIDRRRFYEKLGRAYDETVELLPDLEA
ncbi:MAG: RraA family protein [Spirochaetaceae bacterium]|nr:MAG: RraA family protein [Spirochaetaceae bacterium]